MRFKEITGGVTAPQGFQAGGISAGIKKDNKKDLAILFSRVPAVSAGVFTTNRVKAASLLVTMKKLKSGLAQAIVINSGNANACTGEQGIRDAEMMASVAAEYLNLPVDYVLVASTGVIGQKLPVELIIPAIRKMARELEEDGGTIAAEAIMTTDTVPKELALSFTLKDRQVTIGGMAKGSGMIHPNMATMMAFLSTDAAISPVLLRQALKHAVDRSFNMVTVDGDSSTNDLVVIMANGLAKNQEINCQGEEYELFKNALTCLCTRLAIAIARDGEGATKLLEVQVRGAPTEQDARLAARAVARSNLVKAAVFGEDANWGRVLCAAGYSGAKFNPDKVDIFLGEEQVACNGKALPFCEERAASILKEKTVRFLIDFKVGDCNATAWGCDLSYDYVRINASYRT